MTKTIDKKEEAIVNKRVAEVLRSLKESASQFEKLVKDKVAAGR
jgi:hypothetical protein